MLINRYTIEEALEDKKYLHAAMQALARLVSGEEKTTKVNLSSRNGTFLTIKPIKHYDLHEAIKIFTEKQNADPRKHVKRSRKNILDVLKKIKEKQ